MTHLPRKIIFPFLIVSLPYTVNMNLNLMEQYMQATQLTYQNLIPAFIGRDWCVREKCNCEHISKRIL